LVWIYTVLAFFFSFIMFQTATRGTILGWIAGIIIASIIYVIWGRAEKGQSSRSRLIIGGVIALIFILGIAFYFNRDAQWIKNNGVLGRLATISLSDTKTQARGFIWPMAVKGVFESPKTAIIGVGQENFNYIFNANYDPQMWRHEQWFDRAHSVFLDWLVAGGLLGLIAYLSLYLLSLIYIIRSDLSIGQKSIMVGLLVSYGIHNIFVFDNQTSYVMFFTILAFVHSFKAGKIPKIFASSDKPVTEDYKTVINYVFVPIITILFIAGFYFINVRPIQANTRLITTLRLCSDPKNASVKVYESVFGLDETVANQEAREQLLTCAANVIRGNVPLQQKTDFYNLVKTEIDKQVATTPNDARVYIIAGGFYNSIQDWNRPYTAVMKPAVRTTLKNLLQFSLVVSTEERTIKYAQRWIMVIQPSILSKFDQILLRGFNPIKSATSTIRAKTVINTVILFILGATLLSVPTTLVPFSRRASMSHIAKMISTIILKANALPVINGKNRPFAT
jgi:hypothetical protein